MHALVTTELEYRRCRLLFPLRHRSHSTKNIQSIQSIARSPHPAMHLALSEPLSSLVRGKYEAAKTAGHLLFSPTQLSIIRSTSGVPVRKCMHTLVADMFTPRPNTNWTFSFNCVIAPRLLRSPFLQSLHLNQRRKSTHLTPHLRSFWS